MPKGIVFSFLLLLQCRQTASTVSSMCAPEAEEDSTGVLAQLVIRDDVSKLPSHITYVL